jgi:heterodisulfide reductase subunit A-like polyferredoxin/coenzyme F420-reducing hydrogenase delta subunit
MTLCYLCTCAAKLSQQFDFEELSNSIRAVEGISDVVIIEDLCHRTEEVAEAAIICACSQNYLYPLFYSRELRPAFVDLAFLGASNAKKEEKQAAALSLIFGAAQKQKTSMPIPKMEVSLPKECLVIGGGISGLTVAFHLSKLGFKVILASDKPVGESEFVQMVPNYEQVKLELKGLFKHVQKACEIIDDVPEGTLSGQIGSFTLKISEAKEINAPLVVLAGDYEEFPHQELEDPRIITWKTFRGMDSPKEASIVVCQCYGSRNEELKPYCSAYCCETAIAEGNSLSKNNDVTIVHQDIRTQGLAELAYRDARKSGVKFIRGSLTAVEREAEGTLSISTENTLTQTLEELQAQYVILSSAVLPPRFSISVAKSIGLKKDSKSGFLDPLYSKLRKESTTIPGLYVTESLLAPAIYEDLADSAKAVALRVAKNALVGYKKTHAQAFIDIELCTGCETCYRSCPAKAIIMKQSKEGDTILAHVENVACLGCGICSSVCPTRAIEIKNYRKGASFEVIDTIVQKYIELQDEKPFLLFQCEECALASADLAQMADWKPKLVLPIVVPCIGHISLLEILRALRAGAEGLIVSSCTHCHNGPGADIAESFASVGSQILNILGQDGERIKYLRTCAAEADKLTNTIQGLHEKFKG